MFISPVIGQLISVVIPAVAGTPETIATAAYNTGLIPPSNAKRAVLWAESWKDSAGEEKGVAGLTVAISGNNVVVTNGSSTVDFATGDVVIVGISVEANRAITATLTGP